MVALYFAVPFRFSWALLLVSSYAFYMSCNPVYVVLILTVTIVNLWAGLNLQETASTEARRWVLLLSLLVSLGLLFGFKYWGVFVENFQFLFADFVGWMFAATFCRNSGKKFRLTGTVSVGDYRSSCGASSKK